MIKKSILLIALTLICINILTAGEIDDLRFAAGLFRDGDYNLAGQELQRFATTYPGSSHLPLVRFLLADVYLYQHKYEQALELYKKVQTDPSLEREYSKIAFGMGRASFYLEKYAEAEKIFAELIDKYPQSDDIGEYYYFLGRSQDNQGDLESAKNSFITSLEQKEAMKTRVELMKLYLAENNLSKAEEIWKGAGSFHREDPLLDYGLLLLHAGYLQQGDYEKVLEVGKNSIDEKSEYYKQYQISLGIANFKLSRYEQAITYLSGIVADKAQYYLALSLLETSRKEEARGILESLRDSEEEEYRANSIFYLAKITEDTDEKEKLLIEFISNNPQNIYIAEAHYQYGLILYKKDAHEDAIAQLQTAIDLGLQETEMINALFLKAESLYRQNQYKQANREFYSLMENYPGNSFADEAYFKTGMCHYKLGENDLADQQFKLVVYNFPESSKRGISNFYRAEIALLDKDYETAREIYSIALNQETDSNLVWLRIAQSWQHSKEYSKAAAALQNVEDTSPYKAEKYLLLGNIYFAEKEYEKALQAYQQADEWEKDQTMKEDLKAKIAWTYYQLGEYDKASNTYQQLSIQTDDPAAYSYKSAITMFSAKQYEAALEQFKSFVDNFPESPDYLTAQYSMGDCYYNLGRYDEARKQYRSLLTVVTDPELYYNALDGWKWSTEQSGKDFIIEIDDLLSTMDSSNFRFLVLSYKIKHLNAIGEYEAIPELIDQIKGYPYPMQDILYLKPRSLFKMGKLEEADLAYQDLFFKFKDPQLQLEWAEVTLALNELDTSVKKLQYAASKLKTPIAILKLLSVEAEYSIASFAEDFEEYAPNLTGIDLQQAQLEKVQWLLSQNRFDQATPLLETLKESESKNIRAEAQYLSGYKYYQETNYDLAIPELLRVRHLFPQLIETRHKAEILAFNAYVKSGKKEEARNLLDNIKNEIEPDIVKDLETQLKEN